MRTARLGDCCEIVSGATPRRNVPEYWGNDVPWVTPKDLSNLETKILADAPEYISEAGYRSCSSKLMPTGSVLFSSRAPIGLVAIAGREMCTNQGFKSLVPGPDVHSDFLYYWLKANRDAIAERGNGATFKEISGKVMAGIEIPLPPLPEQKRIAKILDAADALRAKRRESLAQLDALLQSTFLEMFGDPVENPKGWDMVEIGDLLETANYGTSKKASESLGAFPVLRMNNITYSGRWDFSSIKYVDLDDKEQNKHLVYRGQILFNRTNSRELVGKTAAYREEKPMAFAGYLVRGVPNARRSNAEYIAAYMNLPQTKQRLQNMCKNIVGMANINAKEFQKIPIPSPPKDLQDRFANAVERVLSHRKTQDKQLSDLKILFDSLQNRAFAGQL